MLETERLFLRPFRESDLDALGALAAEPGTYDFLGGAAGADTSAQLARMMDVNRETGIGFMPVILRQSGEFLGYAGLRWIPHDLAFTPATDIGWVLSARHRGKGYATEAARRWLAHGFEELERPEIVAYTAAPNRASQAVMRRLGMRRDPSRDFDHPRVPDERSDLKRQLVHAMTRAEWRSRK